LKIAQAGAGPGQKIASGSRKRTPSITAEQEIRKSLDPSGLRQNGAAIFYY
jgi:hypothetical protein